MTRHDPMACLRHMSDHAKEALSLVKGKSRGDLDRDRLLNLALVRLLEILGEAASRVSKEDRDRYPGIPWPELIGMRNRLIHGYDAVDFDILWDILTRDLPKLVKSLDDILAREKKE